MLTADAQDVVREVRDIRDAISFAFRHENVEIGGLGLPQEFVVNDRLRALGLDARTEIVSLRYHLFERPYASLGRLPVASLVTAACLVAPQSPGAALTQTDQLRAREPRTRAGDGGLALDELLAGAGRADPLSISTSGGKAAETLQSIRWDTCQLHQVPGTGFLEVEEPIGLATVLLSDARRDVSRSSRGGA